MDIVSWQRRGRIEYLVFSAKTSAGQMMLVACCEGATAAAQQTLWDKMINALSASQGVVEQLSGDQLSQRLSPEVSCVVCGDSVAAALSGLSASSQITHSLAQMVMDPSCKKAVWHVLKDTFF